MVMGFGEATNGNTGFIEYQGSNTWMRVWEKLPNCQTNRLCSLASLKTPACHTALDKYSNFKITS